MRMTLTWPLELVEVKYECENWKHDFLYDVNRSTWTIYQINETFEFEMFVTLTWPLE